MTLKFKGEKFLQNQTVKGRVWTTGSAAEHGTNFDQHQLAQITRNGHHGMDSYQNRPRGRLILKIDDLTKIPFTCSNGSKDEFIIITLNTYTVHTHFFIFWLKRKLAKFQGRDLMLHFMIVC